MNPAVSVRIQPWRFIRSEGRHFADHRCLIPASEFTVRRDDQEYRVRLDSGNWLYIAGIWRPCSAERPEAFAVLTVPANKEVARYQERQGAIILRNRHMAWLDLGKPDEELLRLRRLRSWGWWSSRLPLLRGCV